MGIKVYPFSQGEEKRLKEQGRINMIVGGVFALISLIIIRNGIGPILAPGLFGLEKFFRGRDKFLEKRK